MRKVLIIVSLLAACGPPPQPTLTVEVFSLESLTVLEHPDSPEFGTELLEGRLLVYDLTREPGDEIVSTIEVLGHLFVGEHPTTGVEGNVLRAAVVEDCDDTCLCPQSSIGWFERDHVVVSEAMKEVFGDQLTERARLVDVCETPTSRAWSNGEQALHN